MLTDAPPRKANRSGFLERDRVRTLDLPQDGRLLANAKSIEYRMTAGATANVRNACKEFLATASEFYRVRTAASAYFQPDLCEFANGGRPNSSGTTVPKPC